MTVNSDSWQFLYDFFQSDPSIASLINQAVGFDSNKSVSENNCDECIKSLISLFPLQGEGTTFQDLLYSILPSHLLEDRKDDISLLENAFINHIWVNILSNSEAYGRFTAEMQQGTKLNDYKPYLILYALRIAPDWILYGGPSQSCFADEGTSPIALFKSLRMGYKKWHKWLRQSCKWIRPSILFWLKPLHKVQLYPIMTLLIVLKREWEYSYSEKYLTDKFNSLRKVIRIEIINDSLIYGLYREFDGADDAIIKELDSDIDVPQIKFHCVVAKHIIDSHTFKALFRFNYFENSGEMIAPKEDIYRHTEESLDKVGFVGTRLLLDYLFPFTQIREKDVFKPKDSNSITDRIYLSFVKGKDYHMFWRNPETGELFDKIQIELPVKDSSSNEYDEDNRVMTYQRYLSDSGNFLIVESKENEELSQKLKSAFSDFRHDLKNLMSDDNIKSLEKDLDSLNECNNKVKLLIMETNNLLNHHEEGDFLSSLRTRLRELDNDDSFQKVVGENIAKIIYEMRDAIETFCSTQSQELLVTLPNKIEILKQYWADVLINHVAVQKQALNDIEYTHNTMCSYIRMAGGPETSNKEPIKICEFLDYCQRFVGLNTGKITVIIDDSSIDPNYTIYYNTALLMVIINSIVDNAISHGFTDDYRCESPTIKFILVDKEEYLLLKICNNGKPIDIKDEDFKTRGVFAGATGHTGLGGYQINRYAKSQGGYVELPSHKDWNTEIHLYIKK